MNTSDHISVVVTHPGRQHSYETALAAQDAGMLRRFVTSFYWRRSGRPSSTAMCALPSRGREAVEGYLRRRWHSEIDPSLVLSIPAFHAAARGVNLVARSWAGSLVDRTATWANEQFDRSVARWLQSQPMPTMVHAFESFGLQTLRGARRLGARTVLDVPSAHEYFVKAELDEGADLADEWVASETAHVRAERREADYLFVASDYATQCLVEYGVPRERIVQIPYGADPKRFKPDPGEPSYRSTFRVLYVGQINRRKGVHYLLEAWRRLALPRAELVLVGASDPFGRSLLQKYEGVYRWLGSVPHDELPQIFRSASAFVCPSLADTGPLVAFEAMASALPVVLTDHARSVARPGLEGFVVPIRDVEALCDKLSYLYTHRVEASQMGASGRDRIVQRYTWRHYRRRVAAAYRAIAAERPVQEAVDTATR